MVISIDFCDSISLRVCSVICFLFDLSRSFPNIHAFLVRPNSMQESALLSLAKSTIKDRNVEISKKKCECSDFYFAF